MNGVAPFGIATGFVLALTVAAAIVRQRIYRSFFRYDPDRSQTWDFAKSDALILDIGVGSNGFSWPRLPSEYDTAFLELSLRPTLHGRFFDPSIVATAGEVSIRQYFERGASGSRTLNLSAFAGKVGEGGIVRMTGCGVSFPEQNGHLIAFRNAHPLKPRVLVAAPHPDDAEIAAFGLYSRSDACVATITSGEQGGFLARLFAGKEGLARLTAEIRVWDSITVPRLGGVEPERAVNLCHADGFLAELFRSPTEPAKATSLSEGDRHALRRINLSSLVRNLEGPLTWETLVEDLQRLIEAHRPECIVTPHPLLDSHPDHAFTTVAVCEALARTGTIAGNLLLHVTHSPHSTILPLGENDGTVSLPPHFGEPAFFRSVCSIAVTREEQLRKHLAIEAMHDLRSLPEAGAPSLATALRAFLAEVRGHLTGLQRDPSNFHRRAVRPNELFFVVPFAEAAALRETFLKRTARG